MSLSRLGERLKLMKRSSFWGKLLLGQLTQSTVKIDWDPSTPGCDYQIAFENMAVENRMYFAPMGHKSPLCLHPDLPFSFLRQKLS